MRPAAPIAIEIARESAAWEAMPDIDALIARAVEAAVAVSGLAHAPGAELSVVLTDDAGIRAINAEWRGKDKATNVLSFPAAPAETIAASPLLGDIVLAFETLDREAREGGLPPAHHITHLTVHGLLHLFGHDHETDEDAAAMEALETRILASMGIEDPYSDAPPLRAAS